MTLVRRATLNYDILQNKNVIMTRKSFLERMDIMADSFDPAHLVQEFGVQIQPVEYQNDSTLFQSVLCQPLQNEKYPTIVTLHGMFGLQEMDIHFAARLASKGFIVLTHGWQSAELDPADAHIVDGIESSVVFLKQRQKVDATRMGLIGVCRGGSIAMITGSYSNSFKTLVSFYGQSYYPHTNEQKPVSPIDRAEHIQNPILLIHGEQDTTFSYKESVDFCSKLEQHNKTYASQFFPDAEHGFFLKGHRNYNKKASEEAWVTLQKFLEQHI